MRIIDDQQDRPLVREVRDEPIEAVQDTERRRGAVRWCVEENRRGQRGSAGEGGFTVRAIGRPKGRLEALTHNSKWVVRLEFGTASSEHGHLPVPRQAAGRLHQRGLSNPGPTLDDDRRACACAGGIERRSDPYQLGLALKQRLSERAAGFPAMSPR